MKHLPRGIGLALALALGCKVEQVGGGIPIVDASGFDAAAPSARPVAIELDGKRQLVIPAHSRAELLDRRVQLGAALPILGVDERARVLPRIDVIAAVSIAEGPFDGVATHAGDPMASLGIFQWAGERARPISEGSSLQRLFVQLAARARCEQCTARDAWQALTGAGLTIERGIVELGGKPATGAELEATLQPAFTSPSMQAYQLLAAVDWIDHVAMTPLAAVGTNAASTLGALLRSDRALATAVLLGVNRPAWVAPTLAEAVTAVGTADEERLLIAFRAAALRRYPTRERVARAARLLTSESLR